MTANYESRHWNTSVPGDGRYLGSAALYTCLPDFAVDGVWTQTVESECILDASDGAEWRYWEEPPNGTSFDQDKVLPDCVRKYTTFNLLSLTQPL